MTDSLKLHHSAEFKAAVALAAMEGAVSLAEVAARFGVSQAEAAQWKKELASFAADGFRRPTTSQSHSPLLDRKELALTIAENSTQGFAMMDEQGYCIYANRAWLQMTGYTAEEIGSKPLHYLVHHHHPDGRFYPMEECPIDRALPENFEVRAHEDLFFRKDGTTFSVMCAASPIFEAGKPVATVIEIRDITERKRLDERLIESEREARKVAEASERRRAQLDALLEALPIAILMADAQGKIVKTNPALHQLWPGPAPQIGAHAEFASWRGWWADGSSRDGTPVAAHEWPMARALAGEEVKQAVITLQTVNNGERRTNVISSAPVRDAKGEVIGGVAARMDITDRIKIEEALKEADRRKNEFIGILAHELRNPLAPIRAALDLFNLIPLEHPVLNRAKSAMARQVDHITRLIDDLLDVARISRNKIELRREHLDLTEVVTQTIDDYRNTLEESDIRLVVTGTEKPAWVDADRVRLVQILSNLLHNAQKAIGAGGTIAVEVSQIISSGAHAAQVTIADTGEGITPELLDSLFTPFVQKPQDLGRSKGGLGLGLTLVKGLTELHGGSVSVESAGSGHGAKFAISIPLANTSPQQLVKQSLSEPTGASSTRKLRIAVIEDNRDIAELLVSSLDLMGHQVMSGFKGRVLLDEVCAFKPDVILCDIGLPGEMNGYDVAKEVIHNTAFSKSTLVALSGYGHAEARAKSAEAGFAAHLTKPVPMNDLMALISQLKS